MKLVVYWRKQPQSMGVRAPRVRFRAVINLVFLLPLSMLVLRVPVTAQTSDVTIEIIPNSTTVRIERIGRPQTTWSFVDSYGGLVGLGSRIKNFEAFDTRGQKLNVRVLAPGQFETYAPASRVTYEVSTKPPARASDAALVSWLTPNHGILHLSDILPLAASAQVAGAETNVVAVRVSVPEGWTAYSDAEVTALRALRFADLDGAVIVVGKTLRRFVRADSGKLFKVLTGGDWAFSGDDALDTVARIIKLHSELGPVPCGQVTLALLPFPGMASNNWSAETRGCTVTMLMGMVPSKTAALAQLGNALTHELFHLWIPNGVALAGDYDWFFEGFTMYQAARAAVRLGYISFSEFLNAIARAYDGSAASDVQRLSLVDASKQRWTNGAASVYSKAMVVALLYDLKLRDESKGKRSLDDLYREILRDYLSNSKSQLRPADGNTAALAALHGQLPKSDFVEQFVTAPIAISLEKELAPFGLRAERFAVRTHISVEDRLTGRQRDLLKQLGYNEPRVRRK